MHPRRVVAPVPCAPPPFAPPAHMWARPLLHPWAQHAALSFMRVAEDNETSKISELESAATSRTASIGAVSVSSESEPHVDTKLEQKKINARQMRVEIPDDGSFSSGGLRVCWPVDACRLHGKDKQLVSPGFDLCPGVMCKLMLKATEMGSKKGQACFKKSSGRGSIQLKCEASATADILPVIFRLSIGSHDSIQDLRGLVVHDFMLDLVSGLSHNEEEWEFRSAIDGTSQTFVVQLEVAPQS